MATIKIYLDKRTTRCDGASPLKLSIYHNGKTAFSSLNIFVHAWNWDESAAKVIGLPNRSSINAFLLQKRLEAETVVLKLTTDGVIDDMSLSQLKDAILGKEEKRKARKWENHEFAATFRKFISQKNRPGTRGLYEQTLAKLNAFCPDLDDLKYEDITKGWLTDFDAFMSSTMCRNSRNIHLRNIRTVFNYAIDEEYTTLYPFRRFKIRAEETRKRCLTVEQLRMLRDYPCEPHQAKYRDIFMLMFYLIGINSVDLLQAKKSDVVGDRLEYRRAKTGKLYSIKIEPEAWEIINRYAGNGIYLLDAMDRYGNYQDFAHRMTRELKRIGPMKRKGRGGKKVIVPLFPGLSPYWSRHSWATIAYGLDVPKETISEALGHEIGSRVTSIYIKFDRKKVDAANRRVIDYVMHGE